MVNESANLFPKIWGPHMWESLHAVSFAYPNNPTDEDKIHYKNFYKSLAFVLPCSHCQESFREHIIDEITKLTDEVFDNRYNLTMWVYKLHNAVTEKLGMKYDISYQDVVTKYEGMRATCPNNESECVIDINQKAKAYKIADNVECAYVAEHLVECLKDYATKRGIKDFATYKNLHQVKENNSEEWIKRNDECKQMIKNMRLNAISPVEHSGEFEGLPSVQELYLLQRLCTTLKKHELFKIIKKLGYEVTQVYKLVANLN
jgi:hypothetical protein